MRVHRLIQILLKLDQGEKVKAHEIAKALEVSSRTIYRDIDVLCEAGYPIITTKGQQGGIAYVEGFKLKHEQTDDLLKTLMTHLYTMPQQDAIINALERGMDLRYKPKDKLQNESKRKILLDTTSWWETGPTEQDIQPIMKALFIEKKISVVYTTSDGRSSERTLASYGLILKYTTWYLVAYCHLRNEIRTFNCSKITKITILDEDYSIPETFILEDHWQLSIQSFKQRKKETESYPVEVKVHESYGALFEQYDIIGIKKDKPYVVGMINLHRKDIAMEEIRTFIGYGQILYPEEMILRATQLLKDQMKMYDGFIQ